MSLAAAPAIRSLDPKAIHDIYLMKNHGIRIDNDEQWITFDVPKSKIKALTKLQTEKKDMEFYDMLEALLVQHNGEVPEWLRKRN